MPLSTDAVLELLKSVAAEVITPRFRSLSESQIDEKKPGDLVTVADHEAEELITRALLDAYPDAVVLGEEAYAGRPELLEEFRAADHGFTVDPVDGTKNFVHGSKDHAVMIAETIDGETVRGWIWQPEHERPGWPSSVPAYDATASRSTATPPATSPRAPPRSGHAGAASRRACRS